MKSINSLTKNYYISSFFWSALSKIVNAIVGFISVPLLLNFFGVQNYGILSIATAANAYIHLLDMGLNIGSIKFFSEWRNQGKNDLIDKVAGTSITFYTIIGFINSSILILIAFFGSSLFNVTNEEFILLRYAFLTLALFSVFSWISTVFSQLLISNNQIAYTQRIATYFSILRIAVIYVTLYFKLSLNEYFFYFTLLNALLFLPYFIKCKQTNLISSILPKFYWTDFKLVLMYSLNIFVLTFFQMTAANSRPLLLGMFANDAAKIVAEYRIIEVFPLFILSIGGMLTSILLPKASTITASNDTVAKENFVYKGTRMTSILCAYLCFPIIIVAPELLELYVGNEYKELAFWMQMWCFTFIFSLHTTPCNSLILTTGKVKPLVLVTIIACVLSMGINIVFCNTWGVGSAVIAYFIYVLLVMFFNYIYYYGKTLALSRIKIFSSALYPNIIAIITALLTVYTFNSCFTVTSLVTLLTVKVLLWLILYSGCVLFFKQINIREL